MLFRSLVGEELVDLVSFGLEEVVLLELVDDVVLLDEDELVVLEEELAWFGEVVVELLVLLQLTMPMPAPQAITLAPKIPNHNDNHFFAFFFIDYFSPILVFVRTLATCLMKQLQNYHN